MQKCNTCNRRSDFTCLFFKRPIDKTFNICANHTSLRKEPIELLSNDRLKEIVKQRKQKEQAWWEKLIQ